MKTRFKEARRNLQLTQKEVAKMLDVGHTTYNRYENGVIEPDLEKLCHLADIFNVSVDYLIMHDMPSKFDEVARSFDAELFNKYQQLDNRGKAAVYKTLMREYEFSKL